jgi:Uma2 family endonuclease
MQAATLISVSEYLSTSYRPDCDYVDGVIVERNVGEKDNSKLQTRLTMYLGTRAKQWNIHIFVEQRVQVRATRFRVPDVCVVLEKEPDEQIFTEPPFICVEVLSKDDTMTQMQERINDYLQFGVSYVWVLDPRTRHAYTFTREGMREASEGVLRTSEPEIVVPLTDIFS